MRGTWLVWGGLAIALVAGGAAPGAVRAAIVVALAGGAIAAPRGRRLFVGVVLIAVAWGGARVAMIDRAAAPVSPRTLVGAPVRMVETLPAHGVTTGEVGKARAVWNGRSVIVAPAPYGKPTGPLRRGWIVAMSGRLLPLGEGPGDRRLARQGVAGRILIGAATDTGRRRGGVLGAIDAVARDAGEAMTAAAGPRAGPVLAGMALGTAEEVTPADRDALQASGLWHLAAASGGNVALVVALCLVLGWLLGLPDRGRLALASGAVVAYVPLAGAGPSIQRAGVMGLAALAALMVGRERRTTDALGLAAAATLAIDPRAWLDVGWQLSFAATAGLLLGVGPLDRRLRRLGMPRPVTVPLATTAVATTATAPVMLQAFGTVSAVGLVTNLAAAPAAAITVWSGALAAAAAPWSAGLARFVAEPGGAGARATLALADWGAGRGHAQLGAGAVAAVGIGALIVWLLRPGTQVVALLGVALVAWIVLDVPRAPAAPRLIVFDIGQGSAALLQDGENAVLVDAGPIDGGVVAQLQRAGVRRLAAMVLSHPAADHDGGAAAVLRRFPVGVVLDGGTPGGGPTHDAAMREASRRRVRVVPVRQGQHLTLGQIDLRIRWPTPHAAHQPGDPNDRAAVVQAALGRLRVVVPADAEGNVLGRLPDLREDVLVVSHHGSADPLLGAVLRRMHPALAVISVGAHNDYGHPTASTLGTLRAARVPTLRTDVGGSVDVRLGARGLEVRRIRTPP